MAEDRDGGAGAASGAGAGSGAAAGAGHPAGELPADDAEAAAAGAADEPTAGPGAIRR
jgi:hypothetical protein